MCCGAPFWWKLSSGLQQQSVLVAWQLGQPAAHFTGRNYHVPVQDVTWVCGIFMVGHAPFHLWREFLCATALMLKGAEHFQAYIIALIQLHACLYGQSSIVGH